MFSAGGNFVQGSKTVCEILVEGSNRLKFFQLLNKTQNYVENPCDNFKLPKQEKSFPIRINNAVIFGDSCKGVFTICMTSEYK